MYEFDERRRPLLMVHMHGHVTPDEFARFKADLEALVERGETYAIVLDIVDVAIPPSHEVMELLQWTRELRLRHREVFEFDPEAPPTYSAYHMPSKVGKLLRFFLQMSPTLAAQYTIAASLPEAIEACEAALRRFGVEFPARRETSGGP